MRPKPAGVCQVPLPFVCLWSGLCLFSPLLNICFNYLHHVPGTKLAPSPPSLRLPSHSVGLRSHASSDSTSLHNGRSGASIDAQNLVEEEQQDEPDWHDLRFRGVGLLLGAEALARLRGARAGVLGIGGVGTWVVEGLARSGIGGLTLVDLDDVCISNTNRQLHALSHTVGRPKVEVMAERILQINPECRVDAVHAFFCEETADTILERQHLDVVIDAIDDVAEKCRLVDQCRRRGIPIVVSGGLGGKFEPTQFCEADITRVEGDGLLKRVRSTLRKRYGYPAGKNQPRKRGKKWGLTCVFSPEPPRFVAVGTECESNQVGARRSCNTGFGTFCPAAGALGFALAAAATKMILSQREAISPAVEQIGGDVVALPDTKAKGGLVDSACPRLY